MTLREAQAAGPRAVCWIILALLAEIAVALWVAGHA